MGTVSRRQWEGAEVHLATWVWGVSVTPRRHHSNLMLISNNGGHQVPDWKASLSNSERLDYKKDNSWHWLKKKKHLFYLAVLGLSCGTECGCILWDLLFWHTDSLVATRRLQNARLSSCGTWAQLLHDMLDPSSPTRVQTHVSYTARWILNHWTTRELPNNWYLTSTCCLLGIDWKVYLYLPIHLYYFTCSENSEFFPF